MKKNINVMNGMFALTVLIIGLVTTTMFAYTISPSFKGYSSEQWMDPMLFWILAIVILGIIFVFLFSGLFVLKPYQSAIANLFGGSYNGTLDKEGIYYTNPFNDIKKVNMAIRNNETSIMKITDKDGKPIDISVIYKWRVEDTYLALFKLKDYEDYVKTQSEALCRKTLKNYTYKQLTTDNKAIEQIEKDFSNEMKQYGIIIEDCELSSISYATEIAKAMLKKQEASAVVEAKTIIAKGAVQVIKSIKTQLDKENGLKVNEEDTSKMISNLTVVMMSNESTQPVITLQ